ncbi:MAG: sugar phosphate isomerase/epimerase [candidate division KSB1 bacterium]|nr:sugar phosphate isomerase/epimerase [candidate division KSB1 bacterium]MDZ7276324.1 sugar phosphate isomerase/epimerase [candidate division KSB1 bacterium]MDZ7287723.1 sugar phosphate isomerase/epimerase [candidate division KSB1 bacterium]MDZ7299937.1 sugar phosphate isomerase/epimerase [candidate division KSB1 bacterium]MDZ7305734.1 sugar phosphate isomerase/epimerase [candidate division KSB1 bacterium]
MRIGFVTDEISAEVVEALTIGLAWGVRDFELRVIGDRRVPAITPATVGQILALQQKHGLRLTALSPGVFKGTVHDTALWQHELRETLPATFDLARVLGTPLVIVFGFQRSPRDVPGDVNKVVEIFRQAAQAAHAHGLILAVENEPGFWCDTGGNTSRLLAQVNSPALRANWDPGNAVGTAELPYPEGYDALKPWIANVHVKDTIKGALVECVPVGEGRVNWRGQLQALARDKVVPHVTIETHCLPLLENSRKNLEVVRRMLAEIPRG